MKGIKRFIAQIDKRKEGIAKERDKLDGLIDELTQLKDDCDEAYRNLDDARDALSRLL